MNKEAEVISMGHQQQQEQKKPKKMGLKKELIHFVTRHEGELLTSDRLQEEFPDWSLSSIQRAVSMLRHDSDFTVEKPGHSTYKIFINRGAKIPDDDTGPRKGDLLEVFTASDKGLILHDERGTLYAAREISMEDLF